MGMRTTSRTTRSAEQHDDPTERVSFARAEFYNFKALAQFALPLEGMNILLGANNAGKSTALAAFRVLAAGLRAARSKAPNTVTHSPSGERRSGWTVSLEDLPFSIENVHTNYNNQPAHVTFTLSNGNLLGLTFPPDGGCALYAETVGKTISAPAAFRAAFPVSVGVVPVLGPVEHEEQLLEKATVSRGLATHRAARHFRSFWHHFPEQFDEFADLVSDTWPGMAVSRPEFGSGPSGVFLHMFCSEDRIDRELYWVGFGFQIWCQLLTHIVRSRDATLLVLDEPETYLHPDVQRRLLGILRRGGADILMATHSSEIISDADPHELVVVNKREREASRMTDMSNVQLHRIGSLHNVTLTHLAQTRRVLFAHPDDLRTLSLAAGRLGREFVQRYDYTVLHVGREISEATAAEALQLLAQTLGETVVGALIGPQVVGVRHDTKLAIVSRYAGAELISELLTPEAVVTAARAALKRRSRGRGDAPSVADADLRACVQRQLEEGGSDSELTRVNAGLQRDFGVRMSLGDIVGAADEGILRRVITPLVSDIERLRAATLEETSSQSRRRG